MEHRLADWEAAYPSHGSCVVGIRPRWGIRAFPDDVVGVPVGISELAGGDDMNAPSPPDRIAQLEAELRAAIAERDMYRALAEQVRNQDASMHEHARNWRAFCRLIGGAVLSGPETRGG